MHDRCLTQAALSLREIRKRIGQCARPGEVGAGAPVFEKQAKEQTQDTDGETARKSNPQKKI